MVHTHTHRYTHTAYKVGKKNAFINFDIQDIRRLSQGYTSDQGLYPRHLGSPSQVWFMVNLYGDMGAMEVRPFSLVINYLPKISLSEPNHLVSHLNTTKVTASQ